MVRTACWYVDECALEARIAKLIGDRLVSLKFIPRAGPALARPQAGDVYLARIAKAARGMRGSFVDLGEGGEGLVRTRAIFGEGTFITARVIQCAYGSKLAVLKPEDDVGSAAAIQDDRRARRISEPASAAQYLLARARADEPIIVDSDRPWPGPPAETAKPDLFEREGIDAQIEAALEPAVPLPCGGRLMIEQTQALTAIDVDAGSSARSSDANAEAAAEIPRQISVRALAGNIIVDFAQINRAGALAPLKERIAAAASDAGIELQIGTAGRTGLLELQRQRVEAPLSWLLTEAGITHSAVPLRLRLEAQAARLARAVRIASTHMPGALDLHLGAALADWLAQGAGRPVWEAILAASPARLRLVPGTVDDVISVERSPRSTS